MILDRSRGIERCQVLNFDRYSYQEAIERCPQQKGLDGSRSYWGDKNFLDGSRSCREAIKKNSQKPRWIENAIIAIEKESLKGSIDSQLSRGIQQLSRLLKNSFSRIEKHRYECNQACCTTKDPNNILNSQKHLSTHKNVQLRVLKHTHTHTHTHTHILNKSNQFYVSKTSQDSFVSMH